MPLLRPKTLKIIFFLIVVFISQAAYCSNQRFISLSPAATEILFALGLGELIVGDTTFCNYPEQALAVPKVGTFSEANIEKVISLNPDIIFATGLEQAQTVRRLEQVGLKVFVSDPKNLAELMQSIIQIGRLTGKESEAEALVLALQGRIDIIKSKVERIPQDKKPKVFIEIWHDPLMTAGSGSIVDELIALSGGVNIANDTQKPYSRFSAEVAIQRNPDVIILGYMTKDNTKDLVSNRFGWKNINAVRNKRVISDINPDLILRPGPRIVDGLEEIHKRLYYE
ncbi:MAG: cobalamin-binding protein [Candidatus Omnitrophica bacterium]|nr:cobalamin-binding protein [Candidatus Omnitrophota bacterium]